MKQEARQIVGSGDRKQVVGDLKREVNKNCPRTLVECKGLRDILGQL